MSAAAAQAEEKPWRMCMYSNHRTDHVVHLAPHFVGKNEARAKALREETDRRWKDKPEGDFVKNCAFYASKELAEAGMRRSMEHDQKTGRTVSVVQSSEWFPKKFDPESAAGDPASAPAQAKSNGGAPSKGHLTVVDPRDKQKEDEKRAATVKAIQDKHYAEQLKRYEAENAHKKAESAKLRAQAAKVQKENEEGKAECRRLHGEAKCRATR